MTSRRSACALAFSATVFATTCSAMAQPATEGERLFVEGRTLLEQGKLDEACARFERSYDLEHTIGSLLNLANCEEQRGRVRAALARWREGAQRAEAESERDFATTRARELETKAPRITVRLGVGAEAATVRIDGESAKAGEAVIVDPGKHVVVATLEAAGVPVPRTERAEIDVAMNKSADVLLLQAAAPVTAPQDQAQPQESFDWSIPGWISLGIGAAGGIVFIATGVVTLGQCDAEIGGESNVCVDDAGNPTNTPTGLLAANVVGAVVGIVGVGLGITFLVIEATDEDAPSAAVSAKSVPGGAMLVVDAAF